MKKRHKGKWWNKKGKWILRTGQMPNIEAKIICQWYHQFGTGKCTNIVVVQNCETGMKEYLDNHTFEITVVKGFKEIEEFDIEVIKERENKDEEKV